MRITVIGSMKFLEEYEKLKVELEKKGHKIILPEPDEFYKNEKNPKKKAMEDFNEHLLESDAILVGNFHKEDEQNYIGINALMEIGMAFNRNKKIFILNDIPKGYEDELKNIGAVILSGNLSKIK